MTYSSEVLADSPLAYWRLGESSGTTAADSSGNGRNATYVNSPTLGATGLLIGDSDKAMQTAADTGQCTSIASAAWMPTTAFTAECMVKFSSLADATNGDALVSRYTGFGFQWLLWRNLGAVAGLQVQTSGGFVNAVGTSTLYVGNTYHVAGTWDGTTLKVYVNGALEGSATSTGPLVASTAVLDVGRYSETNGTTPGAVIDEAAVYGTALSATRIAAHYAAAVATTGLAGTVVASSTTAGALLSTRGLTGAIPATSAVSGALSSSGSSGGLSGTVGVTSGTSGTTVNADEPDDAAEFTPELPAPTLPPVVTTGRVLVSVATSLPAPVLVDGRPQ